MGKRKLTKTDADGNVFEIYEMTETDYEERNYQREQMRFRSRMKQTRL